MTPRVVADARNSRSSWRASARGMATTRFSKGSRCGSKKARCALSSDPAERGRAHCCGASTSSRRPTTETCSSQVSSLRADTVTPAKSYWRCDGTSAWSSSHSICFRTCPLSTTSSWPNSACSSAVRTRRASVHSSYSTVLGCPIKQSSTRPSCPAVSSNASRLRVHSHWSPRSCSSTSPPAHWTPSWPKASSPS